MDNSTAPTYIGSTNGSLAGSNVLSITLAGSTPDNLLPAGPTIDYFSNGRIRPVDVSVPGIPGLQYAFVQLVAWDSSQWGSEFETVPKSDLGKTDIVQVSLNLPNRFERWSPRFGSSAIVPTSVPEPSKFAMVGLGLSLIGLSASRCRNI